MNNRYRAKLGMLHRRKAWLERRLQNYKGGNPSYDKSELAAISWAIRVIEACPDMAMELFEDRNID